MSGHGKSREDQVRERAYALWEEEGRPEGRELDHWERASNMGQEEETGTAGTRGNVSQGTAQGAAPSERASVDQHTPSQAGRANLQNTSGTLPRSGTEPEAKSRKPL